MKVYDYDLEETWCKNDQILLRKVHELRKMNAGQLGQTNPVNFLKSSSPLFPFVAVHIVFRQMLLRENFC